MLTPHTTLPLSHAYPCLFPGVLPTHVRSHARRYDASLRLVKERGCSRRVRYLCLRASVASRTYLWAVDVRAEQVVAIEPAALGVLARTPFHSCLATCTRLTLHTTYVLLVRLVHFPTFALSVCLGICVLKCPRESQFWSRSLFLGSLSPYTKCPGGWHIVLYAVMKNTQTHFWG
jgi:hypothetical protein